jgi:hypothetical protein
VKARNSGLTILSGANSAYARTLEQLLESARRVGALERHRFLLWDIGLSGAEHARLARRFPECELRRLDFGRHPAHIDPLRGTCAWKPVVIRETAQETGGLVLWLDAGTLLHADPGVILPELRENGVYSLRGQSPLWARAHPETLRRLGSAPECLDRPERVGGVCGFDASLPAVRELLRRWSEAALDEDCIAPRGEKPAHVVHMWEQAILTILLFQAEARGEIRLGDGEVDISSPRPVRWLSTRNRVPEGLPHGLGVAFRLYRSAWKAADRRLIAWNRRWTTRVHGLDRFSTERFEIVLTRAATGERVRVPGLPYTYRADPFLWRSGGRAYLFFEEFLHRENKGRIAVCVLDERLQPGEARTALERDYHLSYPFLWAEGERLHMIPESSHNLSVDLYECERFPDRWRLARRLLQGIDAADSTLLRHDGRLWLFTSARDPAAGAGRYLALFQADDLSGEWRAHPVNARRLYAGSPWQSGRAAGPFLRVGDGWLRPVQRSTRFYGEGLGFRRILRLTPTEFEEEPADAPSDLAALLSGVSPHHVDRCGELVACDERTRFARRQLLPGLGAPARGRAQAGAVSAPGASSS